VSEVAISYPIAQRVAARLRRDGIRADILPVTVPPGYEADAFVALHADGSRSARPRGYKVAASDWGPPQGAALAEALSEEYAAATGLPWHDVITRDMRRYYAFNYRRSRYAVTPSTPAVILELGFVSNPEDRSVMTNRADAVVEGVYRGLRRYLGARGE
jgi:N-acetylmuramoyl-L-alanine amidase